MISLVNKYNFLNSWDTVTGKTNQIWTEREQLYVIKALKKENMEMGWRGEGTIFAWEVRKAYLSW